MPKKTAAEVADMEALRSGPDEFGGFSVWREEDGDVHVEWPNMTILLKEAKEALKPSSTEFE
jgi:hypothetical protein